MLRKLILISGIITVIFLIIFMNMCNLSKKAYAAEIYPIKNAQKRKNRKIVVHGYSYTLKLYESDGSLIKKYPIGIGINGMGKTKEGDKKTPLGVYKIVWMASRYAKTDGGYIIRNGMAFCGPNNCFTTDPNVGYSSEKLWTEGYGGNEAVVMCVNYPNKSDKMDGFSGGCIEIHATHLGGIGKKSSYGCIRMKPKDARDLYNHIGVGTQVIFLER